MSHKRGQGYWSARQYPTYVPPADIVPNLAMLGHGQTAERRATGFLERRHLHHLLYQSLYKGRKPLQTQGCLSDCKSGSHNAERARAGQGDGQAWTSPTWEAPMAHLADMADAHENHRAENDATKHGDRNPDPTRPCRRSGTPVPVVSLHKIAPFVQLREFS